MILTEDECFAALDDDIAEIEETRVCEEEWSVIMAMCRAIEAAVIAKLAQGVDMPEAVNNDLADDISAIDAMYRGDPTYEHDAYYMRKAAEKCVRKGYALYTADQLRTCIAAAGVKAYAAAGASPVEPSLARAVEPFEVDWPEYHQRAMGCGLEDRGIRDRYAAMQYGWDQAIERVAERLPETLYATPQAAAQPPAPSEAAREYMTGYSDGREWAAAPIPQQPSVPEGWKLVPIEPTEAMLEVGFFAENDVFDSAKTKRIHVWKDMLSAAPQPKETK